jgi:hypothetical protein
MTLGLSTIHAPEGIRYINAQDFGNSVWSPSLTLPTAPVTNSQEIILDDDSKYTPKMFVGPQGQIYRRFGVYRQVRALPTIVYKN